MASTLSSRSISDFLVAGCPEPCADHATKLVKFGESILSSIMQFNKRAGTDFHVRIGINSGPVVAGVIGLSKVRKKSVKN